MLDLGKLPDLDKTDYKPLYIQLSEILEDYIMAKEISPKTPLPSEKDLMERYSISRTTARLAIQRLEASNLVYRVRGKGTFLNDSHIKKYLSVMPKGIEDRIRELGLTLTHILLELIDDYPPENWRKEFDLLEGNKVCLMRRLKIVDENPFGIEEWLFHKNLADRINRNDLKVKSIFNLVESIPRYNIFQIDYNFESRVVSDQESKEMKVPGVTPVLVRKGIYYNHDRKPFAWSRFILLTTQLNLKYTYQKEGDKWLAI